MTKCTLHNICLFDPQHLKNHLKTTANLTYRHRLMSKKVIDIGTIFASIELAEGRLRAAEAELNSCRLGLRAAEDAAKRQIHMAINEGETLGNAFADLAYDLSGGRPNNVRKIVEMAEAISEPGTEILLRVPYTYRQGHAHSEPRHDVGYVYGITNGKDWFEQSSESKNAHGKAEDGKSLLDIDDAEINPAHFRIKFPFDVHVGINFRNMARRLTDIMGNFVEYGPYVLEHPQSCLSIQLILMEPDERGACLREAVLPIVGTKAINDHVHGNVLATAFLIELRKHLATLEVPA